MNAKAIAIGVKVASYVEKHGAFPASITLDNVKYNYGTFNAILADGIVNAKSTLKHKAFNNAPSPTGDKINKTLTRNEYLKLAKEIVEFSNKNKRSPNYALYQKYKIRPKVFGYGFAKIARFYGKNARLPNTCEFNSSVFKSKSSAPTIKANDAWNYFVKKTGFKGNTIDEVLAYVRKHGKYQFYFDGHKTNKQVTDAMAANCTDWLQWLIQIAEALGYDWKCLHVYCAKSKCGHVRGQFRHSKHTGGNWINRDPAAVSDGGSLTSIWCSGGKLLATNPSWFMETLRK